VPGVGRAVEALTTLDRTAFGAHRDGLGGPVGVMIGPHVLGGCPSRVQDTGAPPLSAQVEWLERIVRDLDENRSPERVTAAGISSHGGAEIPSSRDGPPRAAFV